MATLDERIAVFRNMLASDPENVLASFSLGKLLLEKGDHEGAEHALRKSLSIDPRQSVATQLLGELLLGTDRVDEAIPVLSEGVRLAHDRGEFQPRNRMRELLESVGATPPAVEEKGSQRADGASGADGEWRCRRCGIGNPRLDRSPLRGDLGARILETICTTCWGEWKEMSVKVINEYRLNLSTSEGSEIWEQNMKDFLGIGDE